jgi:EAL domain-containing protein (putative c-di-GMP-specific phosphodiesterase class I)
LDRGEFLLFYQPQFNMTDGSITGAEALIRWSHPERGLLSPASFIHTLESGPLAATVGSWVLNEACAQAAHWRRSFNPALRIGINLCGAQFYSGTLTGDVLATLARHGLPPEALELEVTENIVLANADLILENLQHLRASGIGIAFDDFGTGYASLSLLKTYPLTRIKIDQSFVRGITSSTKDACVVRAILDMAHNFELETIAEGIETGEEMRFLQREHCTEGQGYYFGKPMSARQFETLLAADRQADIA